MIWLWWFLIAVGQSGGFCSMPPPASPDKPGQCPSGLAPLGAGRWVAQGTLDKQNHSAQLSAGPWQTHAGKVENCAGCVTAFPTTCVADYQGSHIIASKNGAIKIHVFKRTHWLAHRL
jgi:hypothetical protein